MPSLSAISQSTDVMEDNVSLSTPSASKRDFLLIQTPFEEGSDVLHVNLPRTVAIEEGEDAGQVLLIPYTSPFFSTPRSTTGADYSSPSVCPTLSGKFDLVHSAPNTPSNAATRDQAVSSGLLQRRRARLAA